jgi:hypothetical protein
MRTYCDTLNKESAALKDRVDRVVKFASSSAEDGQSEPFKSFIDIGKRYRDAIHHTVPFGWKDIEAGQRLTSLYEMDAGVALCALSLGTVLMLTGWIYGGNDENAIAGSCDELRESILEYSLEQGLATV